MEITITKSELPLLVTTLHLDGKLEGSSYENLVEEARMLFDSGVRNLLLDLSKLTFISSAGLAGIHQVALLFRGKKQPDLNQGWAAYRSIDRDRVNGTRDQHVKLLSPSDEVLKVLDLTGFTSLFDIFSDLQTALLSFHQPDPSIPVRES